MPTIYIDGQKIETSHGKTIIQAAYENGKQIPHFCWHPELSVSGNCRMCLVEVGMPKRLPDGSFETGADGEPTISYMPKLQIACATPISDGMRVRIQSDKTVKAQESVMEFILINHPLDCPICDEAGQCKLQEYGFKHSKGESRFEETKNHNSKRVSWGPNVIYDAERCISCSRCIRFAKEVAQQDVLSFVERGGKVSIKLFDGTKFDNDYSMNVIDICPVGALTSQDFRFKSRVWDMSFNESICTNCARGCNVKLGVRNNEILRVEPTTNMNVNKYWMCDAGRLEQYPSINNERVLSPVYKADGKFNDSSWEDIITKTVDVLKSHNPNEVLFIGSASTSNENIYALQKLAKTVYKAGELDFRQKIDKTFADSTLKCEDRNANTIGFNTFGAPSHQSGLSSDRLVAKLNSGKFKVVFISEDSLFDSPEALAALNNVKVIIGALTNKGELYDKCTIVLPTAVIAEQEGTLTNINQRVQYFSPALVTKENKSRMGMKLSRLDQFGAPNDRWTQKEERDCKPAWKIYQALANKLGAKWAYKTSEDIFEEMVKHYTLLTDMTFTKLEKHGGIQLGKGSKPDAILPIYESHVMKPH